MKTRVLAGFTLIELVVTVAIVGILASVALPLGHLSVQRAKEQELRLALRQIREALDNYKAASDEGRIQRRADGSGYPRALEELVDGVIDAKSPGNKRIYFLRRLPRDPFDTRDGVSASDTWAKRSYASGPDVPAEGDDVFDVTSRAPGNGLGGQPYQSW